MLNNMMLAANMQSTCEAAALAQRLGIPPKTVIEIAGVSTGDSWALRSYYPSAAPWSPHRPAGISRAASPSP